MWRSPALCARRWRRPEFVLALPKATLSPSDSCPLKNILLICTHERALRSSPLSLDRQIRRFHLYHQHLNFIRTHGRACAAQAPASLRSSRSITYKSNQAPDPLSQLTVMASSSGLTRRRGGGGGAAGNDEDEGSRVSSPAPRRNDDNRAPETAYENSENGHKIAFDPRDISESAERSKQPKLTLMEEIILMGLKDKQVRTPQSGAISQIGADE